MRVSSARDGAVAMSTVVKPLQLRGRFLTAVVLPVDGAVDGAFYASLDMLVHQSPQFLASAPLVVDLGGAEGFGDADAVAAFLDQLRARRLTPIGIQNATAAQSAAADALGVATLPPGREASLGRVEAATEGAGPRTAGGPAEPLHGRGPEAFGDRTTQAGAQSPRTPLQVQRQGDAQAAPGAGAPTGAPTGMLVTEPVRSGQRITAEHGDLVVVAPVGSGAELVATGNIHVYGPLRGRALAGVDGDRRARIFCTSLEAELIAIAGLYQTSEGLGRQVTGQRVQAFLKDDRLLIEALR